MKKFLTKSLSLVLILFGLYHIILSIVSIFYIYPKVLTSTLPYPLRLQKSLVEKAFIMYFSAIVDGLYGLSLLIKPADEVKTIHLMAGMALFAFSVFFVTKTELTTSPILIILLPFLKLD